MRNKKILYLVQAAAIAAIYVVLVEIFNYWSFGPIQFRIAEALTILPFFTPAAIPGLFVGCLLANFLGGAVLADIIGGSLATLAAAYISYKVRKVKWFVPIPPIIANVLVVPFILKYGYGMEDAIPYMMVTIGIGEIIVCGIIGMILLLALNKYRNVIFKTEY